MMKDKESDRDMGGQKTDKQTKRKTERQDDERQTDEQRERQIGRWTKYR